MKNSFTFLLCTFIYTTLIAQNKLNTTNWIAGPATTIPNFNIQGTASQNSLVNYAGPHGDQIVAWKASSNNAPELNGGFSHDGVILDPSKTYRFTFWVKSTGTNACADFIGFVPYNNSGTRILSSSPVSGANVEWPDFYSNALPSNKWLLLVVYMHPATYIGGNIGGVYDPSQINMTAPTLPSISDATTDFKFPNANLGNVNISIHNFMWACATGDDFYVYEPRIEEISGQEPSVLDLLTNSSNSGGGNTGGGNTTGGHWAKTGTVVSYAGGKVGIGTTSPDYELTVKGKIHAEEVKIDLSVPAPDYVFKKEYKLLTLEEVQVFINKNGHLPNIPSAKVMETEGVELGAMEMKLLEKIEELTLYILKLKQDNKELEKRITKLEKTK